MTLIVRYCTDGSSASFLLQGNKQTFDAINNALEEMAGHSFCDDFGIGTCKDKDTEKAKLIEKFLSDKLSKAAEEEIEPTMAFLFARIEEETGILEEVAEDIIQVSCVVLYYINCLLV